MASRLGRLLGRARALAAERDRLVSQVVEEWVEVLRGQPLTEKDLVELWDGLTEEAVRRLGRQANGRWSPEAIREAASRVALSIRERLQQDLARPDRSATGDPPGGQG